MGLAAAATGSIVCLILLFLAAGSWDALVTVGPWRFLADDGWFPAAASARFGLVPMLVATALLAVGAIAIAAPAGVAVAVYGHFLAPRPLATVIRRTVEILAGVPSVVFGFWGLVTVVPILQRIQPPGQSLAAGVLILALMILPTVALMTEAAFRAQPPELAAAGEALGLGRWTQIRGVALPVAVPGIASALLLATARALGETMAVLMVCGNVVQLPSSLFDPVRSLTANIALEMAYATTHHRSALFVCGLALLGAVAALLATAERFGGTRHA